MGKTIGEIMAEEFSHADYVRNVLGPSCGDPQASVIADKLEAYRAFVGELKRWIEEQRVYGTTNPPKEVWKDKPFWLVAAELNDMLHDHIGEQE